MQFENCPNLKAVYFKGTAPSLAHPLYAFDTSDNATVYYLAGMTGWGATFCGRPAVLWNPQVQASGASFGMRTNRFGFTIIGTAGIPIIVEACTNLAGANWTPLQTCCVTNGSIYFCDEQWTNSPGRYYRLRSP